MIDGHEAGYVRRLDRVEEWLKRNAADVDKLTLELPEWVRGERDQLESLQGEVDQARNQLAVRRRDLVSRLRQEGFTLAEVAVMLDLTPQRVAQLASPVRQK